MQTNFGSALSRRKWWPNSQVQPAPAETAVLAATELPVGVTTLPFASCLNLRRFVHPRPVESVLRAHVNSMGILSVDQHIDWIPRLRLAENCEEQNAEVQLAQHGKAIVVRVTKPVRVGSEIKVWFSSELLGLLEIPFLQPSNIINHRVYKCGHCDKTYSQPNPLKVHQAFECERICETKAKDTFSVSSMLPDLGTSRSISSRSETNNSNNFDHSHPICMVTKEPKTHVCMFCGKLYTRKYGLKIHLRTHTGHKPLQCRYCGRPFSDPSNLNKHIRLHAHNSTAFSSSPYQCRLCSKVLVRKRDLERHVKARHSGKR